MRNGPVFLGLLSVTFGFICVNHVRSAIVECGFFLSLAVNQTGIITSPNYPNDYPNSIRCIWRFQAPFFHHVVLTAATVDGESRAGECRDFVQLRNDSREGGILGEFCTTGFSVQSGARWLWVMFQSDSNITNSGFQAVFTTQSAVTDISGILSPVKSCRWFEYYCANWECVPMSHRCDGYNDCGCYSGCDEEGCGGTGLDRGGIIGIGIATGVVFFMLVFFIVTVLDRKHHNLFFKKMNEKAAESRRPSRAMSTLSSAMISRANSTLGRGSRANSTLGWPGRANSTVG